MFFVLKTYDYLFFLSFLFYKIAEKKKRVESSKTRFLTFFHDVPAPYNSENFVFLAQGQEII